MKTIIAINGACGRMSQRIAHLALEDSDLEIGAALEAEGHPKLHKDLGEVLGVGPLGIKIEPELPTNKVINAVIDFSLPEGTMAVLASCVDKKIPMVIATTGHTPEQSREIESAAHHIAILMAPNMSLSVNVLFHLAKLTGQMLNNKDFDVEIIERHHRYKKDSPSGTALHFAKIIQAAMGQNEFRHGREGLVGERPRNEIGIHAVRVGDNSGEHTIIFSTPGETLELTHRSQSRDSYAKGALQAAKFLADRPAGRYSMEDVLGL